MTTAEGSRTRPRYKRPWLYAKQRRALFHDERIGVVEASTKAGKTHAALVWITEQALAGRPGNNYWWIAPVYPQARIAYRRLKRALPRQYYRYHDGDMTITLSNETVISFKSGEKPDHLYGEDVYAAVIDEASRVREDAWHAVRSTLTATRAPVRIIGNVRGRKTWAYRLGREAYAGAPNMHYAKITALDAVEAGVLAASEVESAREQLPEPVFRELYLAEPSEEGYNPFVASWFDGMRYDAADNYWANVAIGRWVSCDTALKDKNTSDYTAITVVDLLPDYKVLVRDVWRQRMQFPALVSTIESMALRHNRDLKLRGVIIEDKVSGTSAYQTLQQVAPDWMRELLVAYPPQGSKLYRASQAGVWARNQCILLPHPSEDVRWLHDFEAELFDFPDAEHDDQVDSFSQAILYLERMISAGYYARNSERLSAAI